MHSREHQSNVQLLCLDDDLLRNSKRAEQGREPNQSPSLDPLIDLLLQPPPTDGTASPRIALTLYSLPSFPSSSSAHLISTTSPCATIQLKSNWKGRRFLALAPAPTLAVVLARGSLRVVEISIAAGEPRCR